ncbi:hypothetical protein FFI97_032650 [Variovorax sp. KBS0712]|nr:hypothetical protein FFI97_032650 [Variovorax sp. KBS0712]
MPSLSLPTAAVEPGCGALSEGDGSEPGTAARFSAGAGAGAGAGEGAGAGAGTGAIGSIGMPPPPPPPPPPHAVTPTLAANTVAAIQSGLGQPPTVFCFMISP